MKSDRTPTFWTSDPVAQLPKGQGSLSFAEAEARVLASIAGTEPNTPKPGTWRDCPACNDGCDCRPGRECDCHGTWKADYLGGGA